MLEIEGKRCLRLRVGVSMGQGDVVCSRMGLPELDTERKKEVSMTIRGDKEALGAVWETERGRKCVCVCVCVCAQRER